MSDRYGNIEIEKPVSAKKKPPKEPGTKVKRRAPKRPASRRKKEKSIKNWIWFGVLAGILFLYGCIGFVGVPYYLTKIFPTRYYQNTGMLFEAENIRFNPFTFHFATGRVNLTDANGKATIGLKSLISSLRPFSLLRRDLVCNEITIEEPDIHLVRNKKGEYNIAKIFGDSGAENGTDIMHFSDLPFFFSLNNIRVRDGEMVFEDIPASKTHTVKEIQFDLPTFSNIPIKSTSYLTPNFSAIINGSPIQLTGKTKSDEASNPDGQVSELTCDLHDIDLQTYLSYLPVELPFYINKGTANGTIHLIFDPAASKGNKFSFGFELQLTESELRSKNDTLYSEIPLALLSGDILPVSKTLSFSNIVLQSPALHSYGNSLLSNLGDVIAQKKVSEEPMPATDTPVNLDIKSLKIADGRMSVFKKESDKKAITAWEKLRFDINDYSSAKAQVQDNDLGTFHFSGKQENSSAYFDWEGSFHKQGGAGKFKIANYGASSFFKNLGLDDFSTADGELDAKGEFELYADRNDSNELKYKITKTALSIKKLQYKYNKKSVLKAQLVKIEPLNKTDEYLNLGSVSIIDGSLSLAKGKLPSLFHSFSQEKSKVTVNSLSFSGKASLQSSSKPKRILVLSDLMVKAASLNNAKSSDNNIELTAHLSSGGSIKAQGNVVLKPFALLSDVKFTGVKIEDILPLWTEDTFLLETAGLIKGNGKFELPDFRFLGELHTSEIKVSSKEFPKIVWKEADFTDLNFSSKPFHLGLSNIAIKSPKVDWRFTSFEGNPLDHIRSFFRDHFLEQKSTQKDTKTKISVAQLNIQNISISDGTIALTDQRLSPPWKAKISDFSGQLADIHSSKTAKLTSFNFSGKMDEGPLTLSGDMNIFGSTIASNHSISLSDYPLFLFNEQLKSRRDIDTSRTKIELDIKTKSEIDTIQTKGKLILHEIKPKSKSFETATALAMLTNAENLLELDFDFMNQTTDKIPSLFSQLNQLFTTKLIKGTVSPLLLANGDFTDLIDNEFVEFTPGEFMLTDKGREMLLRYTALLIAHPKIGLELSGGYDDKKDLLAITDQLKNIEQKRVDAINEKLYREWEAQNEAYELKLAEQKRKLQQENTITEIDMPKILIDGYTPVEPVPVSVDEVMLLELAEKRLEIIHQFFTTQLSLEPGRITVIPAIGQESNTGRSLNGVTISLRPTEF